MPFSCYTDVISRSYNSVPLNSDSSDVAAGMGWAQATIWDQNCYNSQNLTGSLIGTAFVVRDMFQVLDALNEDGMLRYWGVSYGSILGATAAAMFPDKVDKLIIDGVVNPHEYYSNRYVAA
jgi:pimeloyl-ACP methyl ester carboxylesterase